MVLFLVWATTNSVAQTKTIDSLRQELKGIQEDTARVKAYQELTLLMNAIDPAHALKYADTGISIANGAGWKKGLAILHLAKGNIHNDAGRRKEAIELYEKAFKIAESMSSLPIKAQALNDMGGVHFQKSEYTEATSYYIKALAIADEIRDDNLLGTCYTNLATVFYTQNNFARAIEYSKKALVHFQRLNAGDKIARTLNYLGNSFLSQGNRDEASKYYYKALDIYEKNNNRTGMAILYSQIAILFEPDYSRIISYQEKSQAIWDSINPRHYNSIINLGNTGESYLNIVRADTNHLMSASAKATVLAKAESYLQRAIQYSRDNNDKDNLSYFTQILGEKQELSGNYKAALNSHKLSAAIRDSLFSQETKNRIAGIESQREIDILDKEIQLNKQNSASQRRLRLALIGGLVLLATIGVLLFWQNRTRRRTNTTLIQLNSELDEANKLKARFFAILSHDLRSPVANLISFLRLQENDPGIMDSKQLQDNQQRITLAATTLLENMEDMLLWSKGQMENFKPEFRQVAVSDLFTYIANFFGDTARGKITFSDPLDLSVSTDPNYLQTIMQNLTANSLKVIDKIPGGMIEWSAREEGDKTILVVTDNGPGMEENQLKALYDDTAVANNKSGFGLHMIRDLAKAIQCKIAMQSRPGGGTIFTLSS
jgi:signal transduction histidine kinase